MRLATAAALAIVALCTAPAAAGTTSAAQAQDDLGAGSSQHFTDGVNTYRVYTPVGFDPQQPIPLLVMVHGCNTSAHEQEAANLLNPLADRQRFVVLYPDHDTPTSASPGTHPVRCWRFYTGAADATRDQGDPATIARQTELVAARFGVDRSRLYLVGMSSGAMMTSNTAAAYPDVYAAAVVNAGCAYAAGATCFAGAATDTDEQARAAHEQQGDRARLLPVLSMHGDQDGTVSPANSPLVTQQWLKTANLAQSGELDRPLALTPTEAVERQPDGRRPYLDETYRDAAGNLVAQRVLIRGMAHFWPGGSTDPASAAFTDPQAPSGADLSWCFLSRYRLVDGDTVFGPSPDGACPATALPTTVPPAAPPPTAGGQAPAPPAPDVSAAPTSSAAPAERLAATGGGTGKAFLALVALAGAAAAGRTAASARVNRRGAAARGDRPPSTGGPGSQRLTR